MKIQNQNEYMNWTHRKTTATNEMTTNADKNADFRVLNVI